MSFKPPLRALAWLFFFFCAQSALHYLWPASAPPLVLLGVVFFSLQEGPEAGFWAGCFAGLLEETFAVGPLGGAAAGYVAAGVFAGAASLKIFRDSWPGEIMLPALAVIARALAEWLLHALAGIPETPLSSFPGVELSDLFWSAALSPFLFKWMRRFFRKPVRVRSRLRWSG